MSFPPLLAELLCVAVLVDLVGTRILQRISDTAVPLLKYVWFAHNLIALSGLTVMAASLFTLLGRRSFVSVYRRSILAVNAGAFIPTVVLALASPAALFSKPIVLFAVGSGAMLSSLLGLSALYWRVGRLLRLGLMLVTCCIFLSFASIVLSLIGPHLRWGQSYRIASIARQCAELLYLIGPIVLCVSMWRFRRTGGLIFGTLSGVACVALYGWLMNEMGQEAFGDIIYGALRLLGMLDHPWIYIVPLCIGLALSISSTFSSTPHARQVGMGCLLFLTAGFRPSSPVYTLVQICGMLLLLRATTAASVVLSIQKNNATSDDVGQSMPTHH